MSFEGMTNLLPFNPGDLDPSQQDPFQDLVRQNFDPSYTAGAAHLEPFGGEFMLPGDRVDRPIMAGTATTTGSTGDKIDECETD